MNIIIIIIILCFILLIFSNIKENMSSSLSVIVPSVINSGTVTINKPPNSNLKVDELCILNRNNNSSDLQTKCKSDTDCGEDNLVCLNNFCTRKNTASCLNESALGILESLPRGRLSTICIGKSCITEDHLKVLKGESPFNIMTRNNTEYLLTNSNLTYTPTNFIAFLNTNKYHLTKNRNAPWTWDSKVIGPYQSFMLNEDTYSVTITDYDGEYVYGDSEGNIVTAKTPGGAQQKCILKKNSDETFSLASSFNLYLSWKDNKVTWDSSTIGEYEKFTTVNGLSRSQMTADMVYTTKENAITANNNQYNQCESGPPCGGGGWFSAPSWSCCGSYETPLKKPPNYDITKNVVILPYVDMWSSQKSLESNDDTQLLYITNIEDIPRPVSKPPVINTIQYNKPNPIYNQNITNIEYTESKTPEYPETNKNFSIK
jgi:hypothetical protein